jgi:putative nucleotidyltransferase with HDIG domain
MRVITTKELSTYKILPFDLYNESNHKVLSAGEVLTPGKLIMLKNYPKLFTEEIFSDSEKGGKTSSGRANAKKLANFSYDTLDAAEFETVINREGSLRYEVQVKIKYYYRKTMDLFSQGFYEEGVLKLNSLVTIIISDVFKQLGKSKKGSQVRFLGEYEICHPLNVAIISGLIAKKLEYTSLSIEQVVLAGLLHDIGKFLIKNSDISPILTIHEDEVTEHTKLGYDLIKNELGLEEVIAKAALEHHENNDGSGYPQGLSSDYISELAQIINVASYYDNLACNRTPTPVLSNRDALRAMLEVGTKRFSARMLYTFIHMFNYDDHKEFNDMIL